MVRIKRFIPNFITLLNLTSGSLAIIFACEGDLGPAAVFILIAGVFDFLDGFSARILKAYSETGKQLDSLADVVSFGVAPAMIAFMLMKKALPGMNMPLSDLHPTGFQWVFLIAPFIIPAFSAYRLAKFNLDERQTVNFIGMPTPANAFLWASFGLISGFSRQPEIPLLLFTSGNLMITIIVTSLLLVSELPVFSLKFTGVSLYANWFRYLFLVAAVLILIFLKLYALPVIILLYIALSVSFYLLKIDF